MLKESTQQIIRDSLAQLKQPVRLVLFTSDVGCDICPDALLTARAMKAASARIALETYDITMDRDKSAQYDVKRVPTFVVQAQDGRMIKFSGTLEGVSLLLLLDAVHSIAGARPWFPEKIRSTLKMLSQKIPVQVLLENDCTLCKPVAETAVGLALTNKHVSTEIIVADDYPEVLSALKVKILPFTVFGKQLTLEGHASESSFLEMIFKAEGQKAAGLDVRCIVCGQPSPELVCNSCKTKIQAEAADHKRKDERFSDRGSAMGPHNHG
jgi:hypothetical protein